MQPDLPLRLSVCLTLICSVGLARPAAAAPAVGLASLDNGRIRVDFDLRKGTYDLFDLQARQAGLKGAHAEIEGLSSADAGLTRAARTDGFSDELGSGRRLTVECSRANGPALIVEFRLYSGHSFVVLRAGVRNTTGDIIRVKRFWPLAGADLFPEGGGKTDWRTLNAPSGGNQTQVTRDRYRSSPNNLLATFKQAGVRRSVVLGGLKTVEFPKFAGIMPDGGIVGERRAALGAAWPGVKLAAYMDCGGDQESAPTGGPRLTVQQGTPFTWSIPDADPLCASVVFHEKQVVIAAEGLNPAKLYVLGFSWWDADDNGRVESVKAIGSDGTARTLVSGRKLPAFAHRGEQPTETAADIPRDAYRDGTVRLAFTNDAPVANAVVSEIWLWEAAPEAQVPADWASGRTISRPTVDLPATAYMEANDPVGKRVDQHALYMADDSFYVDFATPNPFEALEQYGLQLRAANHAHPNPYIFPTVCAWYAGVWNTPGAQNHPDKSKYRIATTPGLVEEIEQAGKVGFLKYAPVAGRLVPDNYTANNPQGWWDDAHWQKEGFYVAPYDTSRKWGVAMQARGGLAFTYFQAPALSRDFQVAHPEMLIGKDPNKPFDYTSRAGQAYMREVYAAMRGGISGMMFDYCDELWSNVARNGGFEDPYATATDFYRDCLRLAKEGLGPNSWIHERSIGSPPADLALGFADSQRTSGDTDRIDPAMVSRSGLRWYKNRVVIAYDMDSKELTHSWQVDGYKGTDRDGRRMMLTMAYVAASRLLLANSFRDMTPEALYDLERTFPYPSTPKSARPVDAFVCEGWPQVYDFAVTPGWHQVTLYNNTLPTREETITVPLSGDTADGALGLDTKKQYYVYDFWNDRFEGRIRGDGALSQRLRPGEARMLSVHEIEPHPQFISTNRHLMQGALDMPRYPQWDAAKLQLSGTSQVIGGETYRVVIALNGYEPVSASDGCHIQIGGDPRLAILSIDRAANGAVGWRVGFKRAG